MHSASVDIAIVNYRSAHDTLGAIARLAQWPHGRVWLVDNSAHESDMHDESALLRQAVATMPWVTLLNPGANLGFGRACNLAFEQSDAEFFLLLNPDARIAQQDLMRMLQYMQGNPSLGAVSPRLFWNAQRSFMLPAAFPQSPWYSLALALATRARPLARWAAKRGLQRAMRQMASQAPFEVGFLAGAVMLLRRSAVLSAGGLFDPDYFMFFEDTDLSLRLRRAGHALALVPAASAVHEYRHRASKGPLMAHSQLQFFRKQHPFFFQAVRRAAPDEHAAAADGSGALVPGAGAAAHQCCGLCAPERGRAGAGFQSGGAADARTVKAPWRSAAPL